MRPRLLPLGALSLLFVALVLAGCGERKKDRAALTQAARVNGSEISLNQVNLLLQQRALRPDQADAASHQVLERLIDQTLALQQAEAAGLDREPRVQQQLEAARREVLARAYIEKLAEAAAPPAADDVRRYYDEHPALFRERQVFVLQELMVEVGAEQAQALTEKLSSGTQLGPFVDHLKASGIRFSTSQVTRGAEQLPTPVLNLLLRMKEGQASVNRTAAGLQVLMLLHAQPQPVGEEAARVAIERQLLAEHKRKAVEAQLKSLRASARIEYLGAYASAARSGRPASDATAEPPSVAPAEGAASTPGLGLPGDAASAPR